jgi:hypothetical protein
MQVGKTNEQKQGNLDQCAWVALQLLGHQPIASPPSNFEKVECC